jgi:hypothetical protein
MQVVEGWEINVHEQAGWQMSKQWAHTEYFVCVHVRVRMGVCVWLHLLLTVITENTVICV